MLLLELGFHITLIGGIELHWNSWTCSFSCSGKWRPNHSELLAAVQKNFTLVIFGIVLVSVVPVIVELLNAQREAAGEEGGASATPT